MTALASLAIPHYAMDPGGRGYDNTPADDCHTQGQGECAPAWSRGLSVRTWESQGLTPGGRTLLRP
jgi:hypothetical protein